jgi:hypothetical protein
VFTGDGSTISAVAVHLSSRQANNTTDSLILKLSAAGKSVQTEYYPISNFTAYDGSNNSLATYPLNWQILKLSSGYQIPNLSSAKISLAATTSGVISLMGVSATNNFDKAVISNSASFAPTSNDTIHIGGSIKLSATEIRTVVANTSSYQNLYIHNKSTLTFPTTASKTLTLNGSAGLQITSDGTVNIGTNSQNIPLSTTHTLVLLNAPVLVHNGANFNVYGYSKLPFTYLSSNTLSSSKVFTATDSVSNTWLSGDRLVFTPNTTFKTGFDSLVLSSFIDSNTFTTTTSSVYTHLGLSDLPYIPAISNLTRNVILSSTIYCEASSNINLNNSNLYGFIFQSSNNNNIIINNNILDVNKIYSKYTSFIATSIINASYTIKGPSTSTATYETWMYCNTYPNAAFLNNYSDGNNRFSIYFTDTTVSINTVIDDAGVTDNIVNRTYTIPSSMTLLKTWFHFALCRSGLTYTVFINGVRIGSDTFKYGVGNRLNSLDGNNNASGADFLLYSFRVTDGVQLYTTDFKPSFIYSTPTSGTVKTFIFTNSTLLDLADGTIIGPIKGSFGPFTNISNSVTDLYNANYNYLNYTNNIFLNNSFIMFDTMLIKNLTFTNNILLSTNQNGLYIKNLTSYNSNMSNNFSIGSPSYGTYLLNNTITGTYGGLGYNNSLQGMLLSGTNTGTIVGGGVYSSKEGVYVDASTSNLSALTFQNIIASNNTSVGFKVSGNSVSATSAYLSPITLNINGLTANNNSDAGIEAYNIVGNISSVVANNNYVNGIKTSIGNGPTIFDGLTSIIASKGALAYTKALNILSGYNYSQTTIKNSLLSATSTDNTPSSAVALSIDSTRFSQFSLENTTLTAATPFQMTATRNLIEGSYLFNNSFLGSTPLGSGITNIYQPSVSKVLGFAFTNYNRIQGYNVAYFVAGSRMADYTTDGPTISDKPTERLTPNSTTIKLRSSSKFLVIKKYDTAIITVAVKTSTVLNDGVAYNGNPPRLILKRNPSMGIYNDTIISVLDSSNNVSGKYVKLTGFISSTALDDGVYEFYVDCDGNNGGFINIDNWRMF